FMGVAAVRARTCRPALQRSHTGLDGRRRSWCARPTSRFMATWFRAQLATMARGLFAARRCHHRARWVSLRLLVPFAGRDAVPALSLGCLLAPFTFGSRVPYAASPRRPDGHS